MTRRRRPAVYGQSPRGSRRRGSRGEGKETGTLDEIPESEGVSRFRELRVAGVGSWAELVGVVHR